MKHTALLLLSASALLSSCIVQAPPPPPKKSYYCPPAAKKTTTQTQPGRYDNYGRFIRDTPAHEIEPAKTIRVERDY